MYSNSSSSITKTLSQLNELVDNLLLLLSEKEKTVIKKRFDLDQNGKWTLERIGQEFSVTRERIRQIEKNALHKMKRNVFNTALKNLHEYISGSVRSHGGLLRRQTLIQEIKEITEESENINTSNLDLSFALHDNLDCVGNTINFHPYIKEKNLKDRELQSASKKLVKELHKHGDVRAVNKLINDLKQICEDISIDATVVKSLIDIDKRLTLTENNNVGLIEWRHIHPRTLRDKILFILRNQSKPMHFNTISEKISKANFDQRSVNVQAVHNELIRHDNFILIGRGIYALGEWGYESGTVAEVIEKMLSDGQEFSQEEIIDKVLERRQVKKITIILALKNGDQFERTGRKRYKLKV